MVLPVVMSLSLSLSLVVSLLVDASVLSSLSCIVLGVFSLSARYNDSIHWRKHKHTVSRDEDVQKDYIVFSWNSVYLFYAEVTRTLRELH